VSELGFEHNHLPTVHTLIDQLDKLGSKLHGTKIAGSFPTSAFEPFPTSETRPGGNQARMAEEDQYSNFAPSSNQAKRTAEGLQEEHSATSMAGPSSVTDDLVPLARTSEKAQQLGSKDSLTSASNASKKGKARGN